MLFRRRKTIEILKKTILELRREKFALQHTIEQLELALGSANEELKHIKDLLRQGCIIEGIAVNKNQEELYIYSSRDDPSIYLTNIDSTAKTPKIL